ncbi:hypothetical protein FI667_g16877, partial [Globisporangium splendens]
MGFTLEGRVFTRLTNFASFPSDLQDDTKGFQEYLVQNKAHVFETHKTKLVKSVYSVKGSALMAAIIKWLEERQLEEVASDFRPKVPASKAFNKHTRSLKGVGMPPEPRAALPGVPLGEDLVPVPHELRERAHQIAEALVHSGFLTPYEDDVKHLNAPPPDRYVQDNDLLVPIAREIEELHTTSVWSVIDGAIYARFLKRKAGLLSKISSSSKDVYVVLNEKTQRACLFESDLAHEVIAELDATNLGVTFTHDTFDFGVRIAMMSGDEDTVKLELLDMGSKFAQEEFVKAWVSIGGRYRDPQSFRRANADPNTATAQRPEDSSTGTRNTDDESGASETPIAQHTLGSQMDQNKNTPQNDVDPNADPFEAPLARHAASAMNSATKTGPPPPVDSSELEAHSAANTRRGKVSPTHTREAYKPVNAGAP